MVPAVATAWIISPGQRGRPDAEDTVQADPHSAARPAATNLSQLRFLQGRWQHPRDFVRSRPGLIIPGHPYPVIRTLRQIFYNL